MRASYNWLMELSGAEASVDEASALLTGAGLEVESIERMGEGLDGVVVGEVLQRSRVEGTDKLSRVTVFDGDTRVEVVCGAPNVPDPGGRVLFARVGAVLPGGVEIGPREIAGVSSRGMICSEQELAVGAGDVGVFVFSEEHDARAGQPVVEALGLRDAVFEIGLTPNRPDGLGHVGLARELALLSGRRFEPSLPPAPIRLAALGGRRVVAGAARFDLREVWADGPSASEDLLEHVGRALGSDRVVRVEVADAERCPRYGAALVLNVKVAPSPFWLRYRLHCLGVRAINNIVDVTNHVLLEHGHPIHAFDLSKLRERRVCVRLAREGERMRTLDELERVLTADDLLICDGAGAVAIAGVMGGEDSEIGADTRDVLIECAYFAPRSVRRTSRRLGLHTDASHRFERGLDPGAVRRVLGRAAQLVADLGGGAVVCDALDVNAKPIEPVTIVLRLSRASKLLGFDTAEADARNILEGLGCRVEGEGEVLRVTVPTHRPDLLREVDLVEELARVRGYDLIPSVLPGVRSSDRGTPPLIRFSRRLREAAVAAGLTEAVTYSFLSPDALAAARVSTDCVLLANPLSEDRSVMRTSLLPGLAEAARHSQHRQVARVALFELGRSFHPDPRPDAVLPRERPTLAILLAGPREGWIGEGEAMDFYDAKGCVESLLRQVSGRAGRLVLDEALDVSAPWLHPRRRASIRLDEALVGSLGELHPDAVDAMRLSGRPLYAELDVRELLRRIREAGVPQARPLPRFPSAGRDIAMIVDDTFAAGAVADALREAGGGLVERVVLFDLYRGEQVPQGKKSLAFRVTYRDPSGTLTDRRVDRAHGALAEVVRRSFGATLR